jgi:hypothetical protein
MLSLTGLLPPVTSHRVDAQHDKRYHVLAYSPTLRVELLVEYMKELEVRVQQPCRTVLN